MPKPREWTDEQDDLLRALRHEGVTWSEIGRRMGLSRSTVVERGRRIRAIAPEYVAPVYEDARCLLALPAGHPATWGLISNEAWPGF